MPIDNTSISILLDFLSLWCLISEDIFGLLVSYYWSSSGKICWSLNNLCSQSCLLNFCYYFCTECCVRVPHFNSTANKASSLPWVSPVANQCSGKHSQAIHQLLQGCPERSKRALKDLGRAAEWGSCSLQGEESRGWGLPAPACSHFLRCLFSPRLNCWGYRSFKDSESCCQPR